MLAQSYNELNENLQLEKTVNKSLNIQLHLSYNHISK